AGTTVVFAVEASGGMPLAYQWKRDGANVAGDERISGVSSPSLTITGALATDAGDYTVEVSNPVGAVISDTATLLVARLSSSITFAPVGDKVYGNPPFGLSAVSSASLPVLFEIVSGPATVSGNVLTIT